MKTPRVLRIAPRQKDTARQCTLRVVTPVHIGGRRQRLQTNRFACVGDECYVLDELRFFRWLTAQRSGGVDHYVRTVLEEPSGSRRGWSLQEFLDLGGVKRRDQPHILANMLSEVAAYRVSLPTGAQPTAIDPFIRDPYWHPYLPGTAIKGAIRTALLFWIVEKSQGAFEEKFQQLDEKWHKARRAKATLDNDIVQHALQNFPLYGCYDASKLAPELRDLLKVVQVGDSDPLDSKDALELHEIKVLSECKDVDNDNVVPRGHWSGTPPEGFSIWAEVIPHHVTRPFTLTIHEDTLATYDQHAWLPFQPDQPQTALTALLDCCQHFADQVVQTDKAYYQQLRDTNPGNEDPDWWRGRLDWILQFYEDECNPSNPARPNLRLGWGSGLVGTTLHGLLSPDRRRRLRQSVFEHDNRYGEGNSFPKSRKLDLTATWPLGWCRIEQQ